jgi:hypothetical protein
MGSPSSRGGLPGPGPAALGQLPSSGRNGWVAKPIPKVTELMEKHRRSSTKRRRIELVRDIQKEMSLQMPFCRAWHRPGLHVGLAFFANYQVHDTYPGQQPEPGNLHAVLVRQIEGHGLIAVVYLAG